MLRPTKLGLSFAAGICTLYLSSLQNESGLLFLIIGVLLACFVLNAVICRRAAKSLEITPPDSIHCTEGEHLSDAWTVENPSAEPAGLAQVNLPPYGELFRVGAIPARDAAHLTPDLPMPTRGVYSFAGLEICSSYPFGLTSYTRQIPNEGDILVYPRVYACPTPKAAGFEPMVGGAFSGQNRTQGGDHFHGVRPMQSSDPVKLIHWGSSAKGQGLMVREFDEQLSGRVVIVLDTSPGDAPNGEPLFNWAARAAASLMLAALDAGHQVEFVILGQPDILSVPPFADGQVVMAALARAQLEPTSLSRENLDAFYYHSPRKAALCYVLTDLNAAWREHLAEQVMPDSRTASVYLPVLPGAQKPDLGLPVIRYTHEDMEARS